MGFTNLATLIHKYSHLISLEIVAGYWKLRTFQRTQVSLSGSLDKADIMYQLWKQTLWLCVPTSCWNCEDLRPWWKNSVLVFFFFFNLPRIKSPYKSILFIVQGDIIWYREDNFSKLYSGQTVVFTGTFPG